MSASGLLSLSRALHRATDLEQVLSEVRKACMAHTRYDRVYIQLPSPDRSTMEVVGYVLPDGDLVKQHVSHMDLRDDPFMQKVFDLQEPWVVPDARDEPLADQKQVELFGLRTAIGIPMFDGDERMGPINVATFADQGVVEPTDAELEFLVQVASLVGVVIGRLRAEQARQDLEKQLISTQRMEALGRLAGEVAHDFNNLLLAILGNAELAAQDLAGHPAQEFVVDIRDVALRASGLSRQLLAFSRGQVLSSEHVELSPLIKESLRMLNRLLPSSIELEHRLGRGAGSVRGDRGQLEQVIMNLVLNARDALPDGGKIVVETQNVLVNEEFIANHVNVSPGRYVLLTVTDDGHGMDQETQRQVFDPFFTTKSADKGTGLGLSVVQGIVGQHEGYIHVYSEPDVGTTFKVYLPLCEQHASEVGPGLPTPRKLLKGTEDVLLADDEEHVRRTVSRVLTRAGYRVRIAKSGHEALSMYTERRPDIVLSDIVMPGQSGLSLAAALLASEPTQKILLMTGYAPARLQQVELPHLSKPFTPSDLLQRIRAVLDATDDGRSEP